jgi:hypothetical protein
MDLVQEILKENTKAQKDKIVKYIGNNHKRFAELIDIFLTGPYRVTQRAAWPLSYCVEEYPQLIKPHLKKLINYLNKDSINDAVKRNLVRLLQFIDIPKSKRGLAAEICFRFLNNKKEAIAIRVFSMTVLFNISKEEPELQSELLTIIEDLLPYESAGFRSRGGKIIRALKKKSITNHHD